MKKSRPLLSDEFLDEIAKEINDLYGVPIEEKSEDQEDQNNIE